MFQMLKSIKFTTLVTTCSIITLLAANAQTQNVVATVNGAKIYESEILRNTKEIPQFDQLPDDQQKLIKSKIIQASTQLEAIVQEARGLKIDETEDYKNKLEDFEKQLMYTTLLEKHLKNYITEQKLKEYYEKHKQDFVQDKAKASHILVKTKDEALEIIQNLKAGEDFEKLAKEKSVGPSSKDGGNLGWFSKEEMVPEFSDAAFDLKIGEFSKQPVQTQFGWHIILLKDKVENTPSLFEDVAEEIKQEVMQQEAEKYIESILNKAEIIINDEN